MKVLIGALTVIAFACGLVAAYYSYKSTRVPVEPAWAAVGRMEPVDPTLSQMGWTIGTLKASMGSAPDTAGSKNSSVIATPERLAKAVIALRCLRSLSFSAPTLEVLEVLR
jgi:hypothetical protein